MRESCIFCSTTSSAFFYYILFVLNIRPFIYNMWTFSSCVWWCCHLVGKCPIWPHLLQNTAFNSYATSCFCEFILTYSGNWLFVSTSIQTLAYLPLHISLVWKSIFMGRPMACVSLKRASLLKYSTVRFWNCAHMNILLFCCTFFLKFGVHCWIERWYWNINHGSPANARKYSSGSENWPT